MEETAKAQQERLYISGKQRLMLERRRRIEDIYG
jgi:hypothetical protein